MNVAGGYISSRIKPDHLGKAVLVIVLLCCVGFLSDVLFTGKKRGDGGAGAQAGDTNLSVSKPWYDPSQPDNMAPFFYGDSYLVTQDEWATIVTKYPIESSRFFYQARFEGAPSSFLYRLNGVDDGVDHIWPPVNPGDGIFGNGDTCMMKSLKGNATVRVLWIRTSKDKLLVTKRD